LRTSQATASPAPGGFMEQRGAPKLVRAAPTPPRTPSVRAPALGSLPELTGVRFPLSAASDPGFDSCLSGLVVDVGCDWDQAS